MAAFRSLAVVICGAAGVATVGPLGVVASLLPALVLDVVDATGATLLLDDLLCIT